MQIRIWMIIIALFWTYGFSSAQQQFTIQGVITDSLSGETLIGVSIQVIGKIKFGSSTNSYGYYSGKLPEGTYELTASYIGYRTQRLTVNLEKDFRLNLALFPENIIEEVVVTSERGDENVTNAQMALAKINLFEIRNVPVLFGERDVLKTLQLLPGIKSAGEGNSGIFVRGGAADQNLILLDEAPVYNASHLLGFFSTFNSDAIKDVSVFKGGMPAQYGGRLSSVLDIRMQDGNKKQFRAEGGIGLISSRLKVEGPIKKDRSSFMVSARRTYADAFLKFARDSSLRGNTLYFYDLNAKVNYQIDDKNTIYFSGYFGRDELGLNETFGFGWGNSTATIRLNHIFNNRLFSNTSLIFSNYKYKIENFLEESSFKVNSSIRNLNLKQDLQLALANGHNLRFGTELIHHTIAPGNISAGAKSNVNELNLERRNGLEAALYISDEWQVLEKLKMIYGIRANSFSLLGKGTFNYYNELGALIGTEKFSKGQLVKNYIRLEPRISLGYNWDGTTAVKFSYTRNTQNLHLMSNSTASSPTDLYILSSNNVNPELADQFSLGYFRNLHNDEFELSAELYYKTLLNQIEYRSGTDLRGNGNVEADLLYGKGRAYGIEFLAKKKFGKLNGWIGYTISKSERLFDQINDNNWFDAKQDRTHDLSVVAIVQTSKRWTFSSTYVYSTGNAVTFPTGKYQIDGETVFLYPRRNSNRMPDYHRLDLAATLEARPASKLGSSWSFGIYNSYNRKNAYLLEFRENPDNPNLTQAVRTTLFGIIPSISWNFKF